MAASSLHTGSRVLASPSTSGAPVPAPRGRCCSARRLPPAPTRPHLPTTAAAAGGPEDLPGGQAYRFKYLYRPEQDAGGVIGRPLSGGREARQAPAQTTHELTEEQPLSPGDLWTADGGAGSITISNPDTTRFRIRKAPLQVPVSFPGSDYWEVEALEDYSKGWPRWQQTELGRHFYWGFLARVADPKLVPFFFYKGLEQVRYSVSDRVFQALYAAAYTGVHFALFSLIWASDPLLSAAVALNWATGRLSLGKWALLLLLAASGRVWVYWVFKAGKLIDSGLQRLAPPIRKFFMANFILWVLYLALSPIYCYPLPFYPFAPGSGGPADAVL